MAISHEDIPLTPVDRTPAVVARAPVSALTPARIVLGVAILGALLMAPLLTLGDSAVLNDPELANLLRFMGAVKLVLASIVVAGVWWRLGGEVDAARSLAYIGAVTLLLVTGLFIVMLYRLPQSVAVYHGAALATLALALQDRNLPKLLLR